MILFPIVRLSFSLDILLYFLLRSFKYIFCFSQFNEILYARLYYINASSNVDATQIYSKFKIQKISSRKINVITSINATLLATNTILIACALIFIHLVWIPQKCQKTRCLRLNTLVRERDVTIYSTNIRCDIRAVGFSFSSFPRRAICVLYWRCRGKKPPGHYIPDASLLCISLSTLHGIPYNLCTPWARS